MITRPTHHPYHFPPVQQHPHQQQQSLSFDAIASFDQSHPANARHTVATYLSSQRGMTYTHQQQHQQQPQHEQQQSSMLAASQLSPYPTLIDRRSPAAPHRHQQQQHRQQRFMPSSESDDRRGGTQQRAMVLGGADLRRGGATTDDETKRRARKLKTTRAAPTVVGRMKPRITPPVSSVVADQGNAVAGPSKQREGAIQHNPKQQQTLPFRRVDPTAQRSSSSPLLTSRVQLMDQTSRKEEVSRKENTAPAAIETRKSRKSEGKEESKGDQLDGKDISRMEHDRVAAGLVDEDDEHADRLAARRDRRRAKALIVKDRTQSATATGAAAGAKVRSMRKSSLPKKRSAAVEGEKGEDRSEGADADASQEKRSKKKRRSTEHSNLVLQAIPKARNIGDSRLTLKPRARLGLFAKGAASVRTAVGRKLRDLAFSELDFLNGTRPSPPAREDDDSNTSSEILPSRKNVWQKEVDAPTRVMKPQAIIDASLGLKGKQSASKYFDQRNDRNPPTAASTTPEEAVFRPPVRSSSRISPPVDLSAPNISSDSAHSAYSLAMRRRARKESGDHVVAAESVQPFIDTPSAWQPLIVTRSRSRSSAAASSAPTRTATTSNKDHALASTSLDHAPVMPIIPPPSAMTIDDSFESTSGTSRLDRLIRACDTGEWNPSNRSVAGAGSGSGSRPRHDRPLHARPAAIVDFSATAALRESGSSFGNTGRPDDSMEWAIGEQERGRTRSRDGGRASADVADIYDMYDGTSGGPVDPHRAWAVRGDDSDGDDSREILFDHEESGTRSDLQEGQVSRDWADVTGIDGGRRAAQMHRSVLPARIVSSSAPTEYSNQDDDDDDRGVVLLDSRAVPNRMVTFADTDVDLRPSAAGGRMAAYSPFEDRQRFTGATEFASAMRSHWYPSKC